MARVSNPIAALLAIVAGAVLLAPPASFAADDKNAACLVPPQFGRDHGRALEVMAFLSEARGDLATYDQLLATVPAAERDKSFYFEATKLRCRILDNALSAYFFLGPISPAASSSEALFKQLLDPGTGYEGYSYPKDLMELVDLKFIDHLPSSPYPGGKWLTVAPQGDPEPGSVLYFPLQASHDKAEGNPRRLGWLLAAFGYTDPHQDQVLSADDIKDGFGGDLGKFISPWPRNITFIEGQDPD
jgi:hypothetical protein